MQEVGFERFASERVRSVRRWEAAVTADAPRQVPAIRRGPLTLAVSFADDRKGDVIPYGLGSHRRQRGAIDHRQLPEELGFFSGETASGDLFPNATLCQRDKQFNLLPACLLARPSGAVMRPAGRS